MLGVDIVPEAVENAKKGSFPHNYTIAFDLKHESRGVTPIKIRVSCHWKAYQGDNKATLINGSYLFSNKSFIGSCTLPYVDTQSSNPGDKWNQLDKIPDEPLLGYAMYILYNGIAKEVIYEHLKDQQIEVVKE